MQFVIIFALIISIFAVMFALQNPTTVTLTFFVWSFEEPLALFLLISLAVGALIISILTIPGWLKSRKQMNRHRKEVAELEDNLSKYRSNLIDAQNSNKDLRQKILEIEHAKEELEAAQAQANREIDDLHAALKKADLSSQEAEQARQEAIEARDNINLALRELELKLSSAEESAETYKGLLDQIRTAMPYTLPGSGGEIDTLAEEAVLDEAPDPQAPQGPAQELQAPQDQDAPIFRDQPEDTAGEKKGRFNWF